MAEIQKDPAKDKLKYHQSVLKEEVIELLAPAQGKRFIDATIGGGGHTRALIGSGANVLGIDRDWDAIRYISKVFKKEIENKKLVIKKGNFNEIMQIAKNSNFEKVNGILLDLGLSSHQLESSQRGFSFKREGPLDMRMDTDLPIGAQDIINNFEERRLNEIFNSYGEEKFSRAIANAICSAREVNKIKTTLELARIIQEVYAQKRVRTKIDPATKIFQALRIVVNSEILNLEECLPQTVKLLEKKGRLVVISYHSLEEKVVKRFLKQQANLMMLAKKPVGPQDFEVWNNPRARSAKLRAAEKV